MNAAVELYRIGLVLTVIASPRGSVPLGGGYTMTVCMYAIVYICYRMCRKSTHQNGDATLESRSTYGDEGMTGI